MIQRHIPHDLVGFCAEACTSKDVKKLEQDNYKLVKELDSLRGAKGFELTEQARKLHIKYDKIIKELDKELAEVKEAFNNTCDLVSFIWDYKEDNEHALAMYNQSVADAVKIHNKELKESGVDHG